MPEQVKAASLSEFIGSVKSSGLARTNRFAVTIGTPEGMPTYDSDARMVRMYCEQCTLPGISYATSPVRTFGESKEFVYDRTFESIALTFYVDRAMRVKNYFDEWQNLIVNPYTRHVGFYKNYISDIAITVQDTLNANTYLCTLYEAYPKTVGAVQLDMNSKDIMRMTVTFAYKYHVNDPVSLSSANPTGNNAAADDNTYNDFDLFSFIADSYSNDYESTVEDVSSYFKTSDDTSQPEWPGSDLFI